NGICTVHLTYCDILFFLCHLHHLDLHSFPTRRSSDLDIPSHAFVQSVDLGYPPGTMMPVGPHHVVTFFRRPRLVALATGKIIHRSEEHTSELQSRENLVCRLLLEKKKKNTRGLQSCQK